MVSPITTSESCLPLKSIGLEGGMLGGTVMSASSTGRLELDHPFHNSLALHHHYGQTVPHHLQGSASWPSSENLNENQAKNTSSKDYHGSARPAFLLSKGKSSGTSDEDESSWKEATDDHHCEKGKRTSPWQRIKWTDDMVKLLISIVNFVGEDGVDSLDVNKRSVLQKKGKWRSVSNVMNERGWYVSPQQCEDKFNDLNKRYKRLTDILGRDTALQVADNLSLLDSMNNLSVKIKDDVKKILSSKHSFYKEMYLYHGGSKSPAAADFQFEPLMQFAVVNDRCDPGTARPILADNSKEGLNMNVSGDVEDSGFVNPCADSSMNGCNADRVPSFLCQKEENLKYTDSKDGSFLHHCNKEANIGSDAACNTQDESFSTRQSSMFRYRMMHLEELKISLQAQALEVDRQRYKWQVLSSKKNRELERMREENKRMKFENDQLTLQLKQKELEVECKRSVTSMALYDLVLEKLKSKEQMESMEGHGLAQ